MKLIIAGSRKINLTTLDIEEALKNLIPIHVVICGEAHGPDQAGKLWAHKHGVAVWSMPAPWDAYGKSAGYIRNFAMAQVADAALLFWDGKSKGTAHMSRIMGDLEKPVYLKEIKND